MTYAARRRLLSLAKTPYRWLYKDLRLVVIARITEDPRGDWHVLIFIGDIAILGSAIFFFCWETGIMPSDEGGAGFCLGVAFIAFVGECATSYLRAIRAFVRDTTGALREVDDDAATEVAT